MFNFLKIPFKIVYGLVIITFIISLLYNIREEHKKLLKLEPEINEFTKNKFGYSLREITWKLRVDIRNFNHFKIFLYSSFCITVIGILGFKLALILSYLNHFKNIFLLKELFKLSLNELILNKEFIQLIGLFTVFLAILINSFNCKR